MRGFAWTIEVMSYLIVVLLSGCERRPDDPAMSTKPQQVTASISLPPRLLDAIAENFPGYRVPDTADLTGFWGNSVSGDSLPFVCQGDFNGAGLADYAIVLIGQDSLRFVVFEQRPKGDFSPPMLPAHIS